MESMQADAVTATPHLACYHTLPEVETTTNIDRSRFENDGACEWSCVFRRKTQLRYTAPLLKKRPEAADIGFNKTRMEQRRNDQFTAC